MAETWGISAAEALGISSLEASIKGSNWLPYVHEYNHIFKILRKESLIGCCKELQSLMQSSLARR